MPYPTDKNGNYDPKTEECRTCSFQSYDYKTSQFKCDKYRKELALDVIHVNGLGQYVYGPKPDFCIDGTDKAYWPANQED